MKPDRKLAMANPIPVNPKHFFKQGQTGLTLLEIMISLSLGLLLLTGIGTIYVGSNQTYRVQEQNARIQESGRYALEVIGRSLRQAGFWLLPIDPVDLKANFAGTPITGTNGAAPAADSVTVEYEGVEDDRDCEGTLVTSAMVAAATPPVSVLIRDAIRLNGTDLQCDGNLDGLVDHQPLVSNVEDLQLLYGIDAAPAAPNGDQSADLYVAAPTAAQWPLVVSVRACVLIRSEETGITSSPQRYVDCANTLAGASTVTIAPDSRLRRAFVATFNLRNRVSNLP
jgi:type IV pilus assembly protein PilW